MKRFNMKVATTCIALAASTVFPLGIASAQSGDRYELRINCGACSGGYASGGVYSSYKTCYAALKAKKKNGETRSMGCMKSYK